MIVPTHALVAVAITALFANERTTNTQSLVKSIDARVDFANAFLDAIHSPVDTPSAAMASMQRWTDITACYAWYAWCPLKKLKELAYRDALWTCLNERSVVSSADNPEDWTRPMDLSFGDSTLHRVYTILGRTMVVLRYGRFGKGQIDYGLAYSYWGKASAHANTEHWLRRHKIPFASPIGRAVGKLVSLPAIILNRITRHVYHHDLFKAHMEFMRQLLKVIDKDQLHLTGFCLGSNYSEMLALFFDVNVLSMGPSSTNEVFKHYRKMFRNEFPRLSKTELNAMLKERARRRIFALIEQNDHISYFGCQVGGHLCAINGSQTLLAGKLSPRLTPHMQLLFETSKFLFKPHQIDTVCTSGEAYSRASVVTGVPYHAACRNSNFF